MRVYAGGVVALLLNHRLIAGTPPGSGRCDAGEMVDGPPRPPVAGVRASAFGAGFCPKARGSAGIRTTPGCMA